MTVRCRKFDALKGKYMGKASAAALSVGALLFPVMGIVPGIIMNDIAELGEDFMHPAMEESIRYFSISNLKGAVISIAIGIVLYLVLIRKWMMKRDGDGMVYVDRWNRYWDLENSVYRPLLLNILPMIFGVLCRILDSFVDSVVVLFEDGIQGQ